MLMNNVGIISTGSYLPDRVMSNKEIEGFLDTSDEWIVEKTGIRNRHIAAPDQATSDLAVIAAERALKNAKLSASQIDLVVLATSTPDMIQPSTACIVQGQIGATNAGAFDLGAVCSGFVYALAVAADMMKGNPLLNHVLVIGSEVYSRILDWTDRSTAVFFGDGAGAVVLGRGETPGILGNYMGADGTKWDVIAMPGGGSRHPATHHTVLANLHTFRMRGRDVWKFVMAKMPLAITTALERSGKSMNELDFIIFHQANEVMLTALMDEMGLPLEKTYLNVGKNANTSGASVPLALDEASRRGYLHAGDTLVLCGFGGGLAWSSLVLEWWGIDYE